MEESGVYNSTTISYENPRGGLSLGSPSNSSRRPWNLSEIVSPPPSRSRWFHWMLLMGGSVTLGLGLIVTIIGIYNQHYYNPQSHIVKLDGDEAAPNHWIVTLVGFCLSLLGIVLLVVYCKMVDTARFLCNPLSRTRTAFRSVVTKPRYHPGRQGSHGEELILSQDGASLNPILTQYNPIPDLRQLNGDVTSEEKANLMANEVKEGSAQRGLRSTSSSSSATAPKRTSITPKRQFASKSESSSPSPPPIRPPRSKTLLRQHIIPPSDPSNAPAPIPSHYKPRHFTGHGYGQVKFPPALGPSKGGVAPLASLEDLTPSLRSSFASVMMYAPSEWGDSEDEDASYDSTIRVNYNKGDDHSSRELGLELVIPESEFVKFSDFRISQALQRKESLSSLSVQSAL